MRGLSAIIMMNMSEKEKLEYSQSLKDAEIAAKAMKVARRRMWFAGVAFAAMTIMALIIN